VEGSSSVNTNGQSPPVKRTRRLEKNHVNEKEQQQQQVRAGDDEAKGHDHHHHHDVQQQQQQNWMVGKERFKKSYRHVQLDERLTKQRCRMEARILEKCYSKTNVDTNNSNETNNSNNNNRNNHTVSLRVPRVYRLDPPIIFLEYLSGRTVRDALEVDLLVPSASLSLQQVVVSKKQQQQQGGDQVVETNNNSNIVLLNLSQRMGRMIRELHNLGI
jgi:tRNA A-37 threonylcarbamoyl transferase component Bud32